MASQSPTVATIRQLFERLKSVSNESELSDTLALITIALAGENGIQTLYEPSVRIRWRPISRRPRASASRYVPSAAFRSRRLFSLFIDIFCADYALSDRYSRPQLAPYIVGGLESASALIRLGTLKELQRLSGLPGALQYFVRCSASGRTFSFRRLTCGHPTDQYWFLATVSEAPDR